MCGCVVRANGRSRVLGQKTIHRLLEPQDWRGYRHNGIVGAFLLRAFSLTTLTTTGYGDIVAVDPFARALTSLESVVGPFHLAITVARFVTMELADRRQ